MSGTAPRRALLAAGAALAAPASRARGQGAWPTQPVRLVVPYAPGGTTDLAARLLAQGLSERLGQPLVIENRPGAGATVASQQVAQAAPDGYTLVMSNVASHAISPALYRNVRYDPVRDFTHIALVVSNPSVLVANNALPARGLPALVALARAAPRGLDIASSGAGSTNHLLIVLLGQLTGAGFNHIPYRGAGPAMTDVIGGTVPLMMDSLPSAAGHLRGGSVRAVAMASPQRHAAFPDIPTFTEQGVALASTSWFGLSGPAGMPAPVVERLNRETLAVLAELEVRARFAELGGTPGGLSAAGYTAYVAEEAARWPALVRASGATVE